MRTNLFLFVLFFVPMAMGADYQREKNWADEIVPSLVIGDPVYLQTRNAPAAPLFAWVSVSLTDDALGSLGVLQFPVLDLYGEKDLPQVLDNNNARAQVIQKIKGSEQIMAPQADPFLTARMMRL